MTRNEEALQTMVSSTIVEFHNEYAAQPVKKFQDKETAVRRTAAVLDEAGMMFDEHCQLIPAKLNFNDDKQHEIDSAHMVDEEPVLSDDKMAQVGKEIIEQADKKTQRASGDRAPQMRLKGQRISLIGGKDATNPYRLGCLGFKAFEVMRNNPNTPYEELVKLGAQGRTIRHEIKHGRARTL